MTTIRLVWSEMWERRGQLATSLASIGLGIALIVAVKTVGRYSERAVEGQLDQLGANVMILPKGVSLTDYYAADVNGEVMPEEYVDRILSSGLEGVNNLSPKLTTRTRLEGREILLTGILPKSEFAGKALWAEAAGIFALPSGCDPTLAAAGEDTSDTAVVPRLAVDRLATNQVLVGSAVAAEQSLGTGDEISLGGDAFVVKQVLPETGTVDDDRVFAHLHRVQSMLGQPGKISGIEMIGCCQSISAGLVDGLNQLLPGARVVTIKQLVATQVKTNGLMRKLSFVLLAIIVLAGGASIFTYMQSNVQQRQREIGTFVAVGMSGGHVLTIFIYKALLLGLAGGLVGYALGSALAVALGPQVAQASVTPLASWLGWSVLLSTGTAVVGSALPAIRAARLDPVVALREL